MNICTQKTDEHKVYNLFDRVLAKNWRIENFSFAAFVVLVNTIIHCRSATLPEWLFRITQKMHDITLGPWRQETIPLIRRNCRYQYFRFFEL